MLALVNVEFLLQYLIILISPSLPLLFIPTKHPPLNPQSLPNPQLLKIPHPSPIPLTHPRHPCNQPEHIEPKPLEPVPNLLNNLPGLGLDFAQDPHALVHEGVVGEGELFYVAAAELVVGLGVEEGQGRPGAD